MGGLLTSTLLTLVFVPAMYTIFDDIEGFVSRTAARLVRPRTLTAEEVAVLRGEPIGSFDGPAAHPSVNGTGVNGARTPVAGAAGLGRSSVG
jgi:hypothetical protein